MADIIPTKDGSNTLKSSHFDALYHSINGAIQESQIVFIEAALYHQAAQHAALSILEIGFGTGLNAFMTYLEAQKQGWKIQYTGMEAYPIDVATAQQLDYPALLEASEEDTVLFLELHQEAKAMTALTPFFAFTKKVQPFEELEVVEEYDMVYYDAFAPSIQPHLWQEEQLTRIHRALKSGGVLTTYCAQGAFKRTLKAIGFTLEALPGPAGKREMTRATKI
ncbi:MAG: tRNA (5-methylaminomethyl-2-thiouridine)(34)-methyltransferase MnmD [Aureispira sp.]